ncbi:hypothetical protein Desor_3581 [Desulfosporosinus orientis DSM 765]|uniref:50S ribosomal protein L29 n=1 Tax=Desulfosporosinus orientis (strain ATCC 19365 / DSM 765 / NCIMB 8382 / VKM B-1628 / Singapore I) TaxID=768706 RepID=G7WII8_DESOD|nr:hypothetical protein [Desulfosporosinus orientis]AET69062.1 hypothetical protein Desor_3581 [Desulfosporosinus orientis DSM 765]
MENLSALNKEDLKKRLQRYLDELEELEEERSFVLKQTGLHLPGHTVKKYEAEIQALKESIERVRGEINLRK